MPEPAPMPSSPPEHQQDAPAPEQQIMGVLGVDKGTAGALAEQAPALRWLQRLARGEVKYTPQRRP